jgi:hypothetical protein
MKTLEDVQLYPPYHVTQCNKNTAGSSVWMSQSTQCHFGASQSRCMLSHAPATAMVHNGHFRMQVIEVFIGGRD